MCTCTHTRTLTTTVYRKIFVTKNSAKSLLQAVYGIITINNSFPTSCWWWYLMSSNVSSTLVLGSTNIIAQITSKKHQRNLWSRFSKYNILKLVGTLECFQVTRISSYVHYCMAGVLSGLGKVKTLFASDAKVHASIYV